jgi:2-dehydropantoate 2-reductase
MNIIIIGQGAMGLLWYHHLQELISCHEGYKANNLNLLSSKYSMTNEHDLNNTSSHYEAYSFTDQNNVTHQNTVHYAKREHIEIADIIILCVKSFQVPLALESISNDLKEHSAIVLAHNGMGTLSQLPVDIIKNHNIYAMLTTHGCLRPEPLTVIHTGIGSTDIGLVLGSIKVKQQQALTHLLDAALPDVTFHTEIKNKQWKKLAINCVINPLTAIYNIDNGQINNAEYLQETEALLEEVITVAQAENVSLDLTDLKVTVNAVAQATARNSSSMRCDIVAKRKTEIDYINGYIHYLGIKHNIATPENTKMWQKITLLNEY